MFSVTKIFRFEAAHSLPNHEGVEKTLHGHSYKLEITVAGELQTEGAAKGMVIDPSDLEKKIAAYIASWDHSYLNSFVKNPTVENLVLLIKEYCESSKLNITRIKLWETNEYFAEWEKRNDGFLEYGVNIVVPGIQTK